MDPVVHFEMPAEDKKRVSEFYTQAFGWKMTTMGPEMNNYVLAGTTETDEKTMSPVKPGAINGGFYSKTDGEGGAQPPHLVISVQNLEESMKKVEAAGGKIIDKPMDIPTVGMYVSIKDTEGNIVGMMQPAPMPN
jgi:predicted enzyme related to lactoylglutathione lyase